MKNYSILFYTGGGGGGGGGLGAVSIFLGLQASVWSKNKREGAVRPPPWPLPLIRHCIWLDCRRGLCCKCELPNCLWYDSVFNQSNFDCKLLLIFSGIQIKPPRSHHCSICKRWIYRIISFSSFNFFINSWILMLRAFIVIKLIVYNNFPSCTDADVSGTSSQIWKGNVP